MIPGVKPIVIRQLAPGRSGEQVQLVSVNGAITPSRNIPGPLFAPPTFVRVNVNGVGAPVAKELVDA